MASLYKEMSKHELNRQKIDLLYHLFVNTEAGTLNDICIQIRNHLHNKYSVEKMSSRLRQMLDKVISSQDRTSKHALVLFALYKNPEIIPDIFLPETPRVPPKKFKYFVERDLPVLVKK